METVEIRSNIGGRLKKIRDGVVFGAVTSVIGELGQNGQRAIAQAIREGKLPDMGAGELRVLVTEDSIMFLDNGCGCSDPQVALELDTSGFGVGFGEGLSSIFFIADHIELESLNWSVAIDVDKMLQENSFTLDVQKKEVPTSGFMVYLKGVRIAQHHDELLKFVNEMAALLPMPVYVNNELIAKKDLGKVDSKFTMKFDTPWFEGTLGVSAYSWEDLRIYFENRFVCTYWLKGVIGNITLKPGAVNLKAPDRREIVYDEKRSAFSKSLEDCAKELYLNYIQVSDDEAIDRVSENIARYVDVEQFLPYLSLDREALLEHKKRMAEQGLDGTEDDDCECPQTVYFPSYAKHDPCDSNATIGEAEDSRTERGHKVNTNVVQMRIRNREDSEKFINELHNLRDSHKVVWIKASEIDLYTDVIKELEYHDFVVVISRNKLYEEAFKHLGILNFHDIQKEATVKYDIKNVGVKSPKERRILWMLERIEEHYQLESTFRIADVSSYIEHKRDGRVVAKEVRLVRALYQENTDGRKRIYIDRKSLRLPDYRVTRWESGNITINDVRMMLKYFDCIAHELAHLLKGTSDNTKEHTEAQQDIMQQIASLF